MADEQTQNENAKQTRDGRAPSSDQDDFGEFVDAGKREKSDVKKGEGKYHVSWKCDNASPRSKGNKRRSSHPTYPLRYGFRRLVDTRARLPEYFRPHHRTVGGGQFGFWLGVVFGKGVSRYGCTHDLVCA